MGCCRLNFKPSICFILKCLQSSCSASVGLFLRAFPNVMILVTLKTPALTPTLTLPRRGGGNVFAASSTGAAANPPPVEGEGMLIRRRIGREVLCIIRRHNGRHRGGRLRGGIGHLHVPHLRPGKSVEDLPHERV